jgi:hypothetical protein
MQQVQQSSVQELGTGEALAGQQQPRSHPADHTLPITPCRSHPPTHALPAVLQRCGSACCRPRLCSKRQPHT